jgi:hypothetical protein
VSEPPWGEGARKSKIHPGAIPGNGNPGGSPEATRRAFNKRFLLDLAEDWQQHGREVFKRVRRESPAAYLKVCALLVPREMKLEHSGGVKAMTDEQLERTLELLKELAAERDAANAKVIEGEEEEVSALPAPGDAHEGIVKRARGTFQRCSGGNSRGWQGVLTPPSIAFSPSARRS